jgi:hypothetical protein
LTGLSPDALPQIWQQQPMAPRDQPTSTGNFLLKAVVRLIQVPQYE